MDVPKVVIKRRRVESPPPPPQFDDIPDRVIGIIFRKLFLTDRVRCVRVSRRWKRVMREEGWKGQRKLDHETVFGEAERVNRELFTIDSFITLFKWIGPNLEELDVFSFFNSHDNEVPIIITENFCKSLKHLTNLSRIGIARFNLSEIVVFLPETLREISASGPFNEQTLWALSKRCPNLMDIEFCADDNNVSVHCMNDFLACYPRLKRLSLSCFFDDNSGPTLTSIGSLAELEEFELENADNALDDESFEAMCEGCQSLRKINFIADIQVSEDMFCKLSKLPKLVDLSVSNVPVMTNYMVKAIAKPGSLKRLNLSECEEITDDSIVYLVDHCKALTELNVTDCPLVTEKSLVKVMAETNRRHQNNPAASETLSSSVVDEKEEKEGGGIFKFYCWGTAIDSESALVVTEDCPWMRIQDGESVLRDEVRALFADEFQ